MDLSMALILLFNNGKIISGYPRNLIETLLYNDLISK